MRVKDGAHELPSKRKRTKRAAAEERPVLKIAKLSEHATTPTRGSAKAAGYDLYRLVVVYMFYLVILVSQAANTTTGYHFVKAKYINEYLLYLCLLFCLKQCL